MRWDAAGDNLLDSFSNVWNVICLNRIIFIRTFAGMTYRADTPMARNYNVSFHCLAFRVTALAPEALNIPPLLSAWGTNTIWKHSESPHCSIRHTYMFLWAVFFTVQNKYICLVINLNDCTTQTMQRRTERQTVVTITFPAWDDNRSSWGPPSYNLTVAI